MTQSFRKDTSQYNMLETNNQIKFTSRKFLTLLKSRGILAYM